MRGALAASPLARVEGGIIPAHAGSTALDSSILSEGA